MITSSFKFHWMLKIHCTMGRIEKFLWVYHIKYREFFFLIGTACWRADDIFPAWCLVTPHSAVLIPPNTEETPCIFIDPYLSNVKLNLTAFCCARYNVKLKSTCYFMVFYGVSCWFSVSLLVCTIIICTKKDWSMLLPKSPPSIFNFHRRVCLIYLVY